MPADRFLDTNILLYGYDLDAPEKRAIAQGLLENAWQQPGSAAIDVQVLQEFYFNFLKSGHPHEDATALIADFFHWPVVETYLSLLRLSLVLQARYHISLLGH